MNIGLLWASGWSANSGFDSHTRPAEYSAPSWSWASIKSRVCLEFWIRHAHFVAAVLEAQTIPSGPDAFGQLKGGSIRVSGRLEIAYGKGVEYAALSQWQDREQIYETKPGQMQR